MKGQRALWLVLALLAPGLWVQGADAKGVLVVGDSISAAYGIDKASGWVVLMQQRLEQQCAGLAVNNASVSGETSAGGKVRLPELLARLQPQVVVIELGGNDGLRGLSPFAMEANLREMVTLSQQAGAQPVLLGMLLPANLGQAYIDLFRDAYVRVANDTGVPLLPFFLEGVAEQPALMQDDGIHPTAEAQPILLDNAWQVLGPVLKDLCG